MDLEKLEIKELNQNEMQETNGGGLINLAIGAFLLGRRVEYVKNGGGWFDYYL